VFVVCGHRELITAAENTRGTCQRCWLIIEHHTPPNENTDTA
jgi:nitrate/TMAO reductase-like tetraheme cytochrome c subunit